VRALRLALVAPHHDMAKLGSEPMARCPACGVSGEGRFCAACGTELSAKGGPIWLLLESILHLELFRRYASRYGGILRSPTRRILALSTEVTQGDAHKFLGVGVVLYAVIMIPRLASITGSMRSFVLPPLYFTLAISVYCLVLYRLGNRSKGQRRTVSSFLTTSSLVLGFNLPLIALVQRAVLAFVHPSSDTRELGFTWQIYIAVLIAGIDVYIPNARVWAAFWQVRRARALLLVVSSAAASEVAGTVLLAIFGVFPPPQHLLARGDCVRRARSGVIRTACDSRQATAIAIGFDPNPGGVFGNPACPDETDFFELTSITRVGCFRNLGPAHPGDIGEGGGILRTGDCTIASLIAAEVPCRSRGVFARVAARVNTSGECPPSTLEFFKPVTDGPPVVCLDDGPGVIRPGDCLSRLFGVSKDPCPVTGRRSGVTDVVAARVYRTTDCPLATTAIDLNDQQLGWSPPRDMLSTTRPILCLRPSRNRSALCRGRVRVNGRLTYEVLVETAGEFLCGPRAGHTARG